MIVKIAALAAFAGIFAPIVGEAQTVAQIGGPAELPGAGFTQDQYTDSRGCVFLRAGFGGQNNWVARIGANRKVMCGRQPTNAARAAVAVAENTAPAPMVVAAVPVVPARNPGPPMRTVASAMMPGSFVTPPPVRVVPVVPVRQVAAPTPRVVAPRYETVATAGVPNGKIGCYTSAPVAEVVRLRNGGTVVVCTAGDGTTNGWRAPIFPKSAPVGAAFSTMAATEAAVAAPRHAATVAAAVVPQGYKLAWNDDRLNPMRGVGTAAGQAAQDRIWTQQIPARLVADVAKTKAPRTKAVGNRVTASTMNAAVAPVVSGAKWVQVGSFGVAANAAGAAQRLAAMGLPVAKSKAGKSLQIVLAGPFGSAADATAALRMARQAGFGDAFIR
jgi:hypothetical protein